MKRHRGAGGAGAGAEGAEGAGAGGEGISFPELFDVLSTKPVINRITTYTSLMEVASGKLETYVRYDHDDVQPSVKPSVGSTTVQPGNKGAVVAVKTPTDVVFMVTMTLLTRIGYNFLSEGP